MNHHFSEKLVLNNFVLPENVKLPLGRPGRSWKDGNRELLKKRRVKVWNGLNWLWVESCTRWCIHGNEPSVSLQGEILLTSSVIISSSISILLYEVMKYFITAVIFGRFIRLLILDSCH
jgi:hypothetical protein